MLAIKNPQAWQQLLRLLAEQVVKEVQQDAAAAPETTETDRETALHLQHHESSDLRTL